MNVRENMKESNNNKIWTDEKTTKIINMILETLLEVDGRLNKLEQDK